MDDLQATILAATAPPIPEWFIGPEPAVGHVHPEEVMGTPPNDSCKQVIANWLRDDAGVDLHQMLDHIQFTTDDDYDENVKWCKAAQARYDEACKHRRTAVNRANLQREARWRWAWAQTMLAERESISANQEGAS